MNSCFFSGQVCLPWIFPCIGVSQLYLCRAPSGCSGGGFSFASWCFVHFWSSFPRPSFILSCRLRGRICWLICIWQYYQIKNSLKLSPFPSRKRHIPVSFVFSLLCLPVPSDEPGNLDRPVPGSVGLKQGEGWAEKDDLRALVLEGHWGISCTFLQVTKQVQLKSCHLMGTFALFPNTALV